ncbi:protein of unknown function [Streptomyces murinus]
MPASTPSPEAGSAPQYRTLAPCAATAAPPPETQSRPIPIAPTNTLAFIDPTGHLRPTSNPNSMSTHIRPRRSRGAPEIRRPGTALVSPSPLAPPEDPRPQHQLRRPLRHDPLPLPHHVHRDAPPEPLPPRPRVQLGRHPAYERLRVRQHGPPPEQHPVDVQQPHQIPGPHPEDPRRPLRLPPCHRGQAQHLQAPPVPALAARPVQLDDLMPELPRPGPRAPVHPPADHEPGPEPRTEVQIREGSARAPDREPHRRSVRVLVHDHRHPQPIAQRVPQREAVPPREPGHPVQHPPHMVERPGQGHPHPQQRPGPGKLPERPQAGADQPRHRLHDHPEHRLGARSEVQLTAPLPHHGTVQSYEHHPQRVPVQLHPHRVPRLRHQPQHRARLAARGRPAARLGREPRLPQPSGDLADCLRGQPGPLGQFQPADALRPGPAQQPEHERAVVRPHRPQVRSGPPAVHPVLAHTPILLVACTLATALRK